MPTITICIPHWQVKTYMQAALRSIRRHSSKYDLDVIVVDNGSKDDSLDYLRSIPWIRLIERPEEVHTNWPMNVFTAWDRGLVEARGEFYVTMHSDVFLRRDDWLDPFLREIRRAPNVAASGAWKLEVENPFYAFQKRIIGGAAWRIKTLLGLKKPSANASEKLYPRDYCAMYKTDVVRRHGMTYCPINGCGGGGYSIAKQLWDAGYEMGIIPIREMADRVYHVAHGTAAVTQKSLRHRRAQRKVETKVADLFLEPWIQSLLTDESLDGRRDGTRAA